MHPRIPRQPARDLELRHRVDDDARMGTELAAVVAGARRRAVRDGDRQIDTAHLLHSLLDSDPDVRAVFCGPARVARLLGYLVQRSIGYGLRWQGSVEDSGSVPAVTDAEGFSPLAGRALEAACARAAERGERARGVDLLAALVADPDARAVEVLAAAGIEARDVVDGTLWRAEEADGGG
ncbi:Clp protease N-terminal domain-containing protein [Streptomyces griseosporeus]|uniref:Clp protease N-terminal domain-containing protein n=1 Tax=Streptomyces griseosporeus TaxID=1910 RepID=UPI00167D68CE|nr:Clp protease N-terminal domain-containing protein [Streptomyces griseosporeus]